jgi:hypothetical protein
MARPPGQSQVLIVILAWLENTAQRLPVVNVHLVCLGHTAQKMERHQLLPAKLVQTDGPTQYQVRQIVFRPIMDVPKANIPSKQGMSPLPNAKHAQLENILQKQDIKFTAVTVSVVLASSLPRRD